MLDVIGKRLTEPSTIIADKFTDIGKAWASKLRDLAPQQAVHAEKIINDVFYEAELGNLNRNCFVQIQQELYIRNVQPPFNTQPPFNIEPSFHTQPSFNIQPTFHTQPPFNTQISLHTPQPPLNTQTPPNTQPKEKPLPHNNQKAAQFFHNFNDFADGET